MRNQSMFSRRSTTDLMLSMFLGPTFMDTEVEPQEPQPRVSEGSKWKLYRSPMAPWGRQTRKLGGSGQAGGLEKGYKGRFKSGFVRIVKSVSPNTRLLSVLSVPRIPCT